MLVLLGAGGIAGCGGASGPAAEAPAGSVGAAVPGRPGPGLAPAAAHDLIAAEPGTLVLDVRNPDEWNDDLGHIEGARQIPLHALAGRLDEIAAHRAGPVVVVCRVGGRSANAADLLAREGFARVHNLEGGMAAWRRAGF
jgi:rhodanese-related sulfurtransferase